MPTLRIMSVYQERKRTFAAELSRARTEMARFEASLHARHGDSVVNAMCKKPFRIEDMDLGKVPDLSEEGAVAARTWRTLELKVMAVRKKIRTPDCWFRESPGVVSVLGTTGLRWRDVHQRCTEDGRMPVSGVLWLLKILRATEDRKWMDVCREPVSAKWRRRLDRRRLMRLLHTAVMLEEDVQWDFAWPPPQRHVAALLRSAGRWYNELIWRASGRAAILSSQAVEGAA